MEEKSIMDALVLMKRTGNLLNEMEDLTKQIAESIDRNDRVSMEMLVAMREEPLGKLHEADRILREQLADMPDREGAAQLAAMLNGAAPSQEGDLPKMLCEQVNQNKRRLEQVVAMNQRINQKVAGSAQQ
ncbi:MAG: DNA replication initiation control protein YabA [Ruminiclostridium sp.]|jgi:hypothetical protein|nr:DNA replication initiation control protein YabA [Ruminiclostridium sp.]MCI9465490.1 DNA replication initiation control protein YabA [Ruminiclostridium sp.]